MQFCVGFFYTINHALNLDMYSYKINQIIFKEYTFCELSVF